MKKYYILGFMLLSSSLTIMAQSIATPDPAHDQFKKTAKANPVQVTSSDNATKSKKETESTSQENEVFIRRKEATTPKKD